jgi:hypothetical protein
VKAMMEDKSQRTKCGHSFLDATIDYWKSGNLQLLCHASLTVLMLRRLLIFLVRPKLTSGMQTFHGYTRMDS